MKNKSNQIVTIKSIYRNKNFLSLWTGQTISSLGDWIIIVAMITLVYNLSPSSWAISGLMIFRVLPALFFGSLVGVIVDRFNRKKTMIICDISRGFLIVIIPFIKWLWALYLIAFLLETFSLIFLPAKDASIPNIVKKDEILQANSISYTTNYLTMIAGSAFGATIILLVEKVWNKLPLFERLTGPHAAFYIDSLTFFCSAIAISFISLPMIENNYKHKEMVKNIMSDLREGIAIVKNNSQLKVLMVSIAIAFLGGGSLYTLGVVYSKEVLKQGQAFGFLIASFGLGLVLGSAIAGFLGSRFEKDKLFSRSLLLFGISMIIFSLFSYIELVMIVVVFSGMNIGIVNVTGYSILQERLQDKIRGRVFSILQALIKISLLVSFALSGTLSDFINLIVKMIAQSNPQIPSTIIARFNGSRITFIISGVLIVCAGLYSLKSNKIINKSLEGLKIKSSAS